MSKRPFVTKEQVEEIVKTYPTPFHLYDEKGIRENAKAVKEAFAWNPGFREYFAVKANPNPYLLKIFQEYDFGCDCSSFTELMLSLFEFYKNSMGQQSWGRKPHLQEEINLKCLDQSNMIASGIWILQA